MYENMPLEALVKTFENALNIPENHHLVAVFENDDSDEIIGWSVVELGVESDYPIYTLEELFTKFAYKI